MKTIMLTGALTKIPVTIYSIVEKSDKGKDLHETNEFPSNNEWVMFRLEQLLDSIKIDNSTDKKECTHERAYKIFRKKYKLIKDEEIMNIEDVYDLEEDFENNCDYRGIVFGNTSYAIEDSIYVFHFNGCIYPDDTEYLDLIKNIKPQCIMTVNFNLYDIHFSGFGGHAIPNLGKYDYFSSIGERMIKMVQKHVMETDNLELNDFYLSLDNEFYSYQDDQDKYVYNLLYNVLKLLKKEFPLGFELTDEFSTYSHEVLANKTKNFIAIRDGRTEEPTNMAQILADHYSRIITKGQNKNGKN